MASGPWDNVQLAGPPNGPAYINAAMNAAQTMGNLVNSGFNAYQQGQNFQNQQKLFPYQLQQAQRQNNLGNLFQGGVPQLPNGQVDYNSVFKSMLQAGGAPEVGTAIQALPAFQKQQLIDQYLGQSGQGGQSSAPNPTAPQAGSPRQIDPRFANQSSNDYRIPIRQGANDTGEQVDVNNIAAETHTNLDGFLEKNPQYRAWLNQDLNDNQAKAIRTRMRQYRESVASSNNPVAQSGTGEQESAGNELNPSGIGASSAMSPRQTVGQGKTRSAAAPPSAIANDGLEDRRNVRTAEQARQRGPEPPRNFVTEGGAAKMVPEQWRSDPHAFADFLRSRAAELTSGKGGKIGDLLGIPAGRDVETAKAWNAQADKIDEQLAKDNESRRKPQIEADTKYYDSVHRGLTGTAMIASQQKQNIGVLRDILNSPNFTPGAGSNLALLYQKWMAQLNIDPTAAAPRELFDTVATRILADQISGLKSMASETGEQGARIFKTMIDLEEKANTNHEISKEGIKSQLDFIDKAGDLMMKWAAKADDYKIKNGSLDASFDKALRADISKARLPDLISKAPQSKAAPKTLPGGWQEIAPGIRIREKQPDANLRS